MPAVVLAVSGVLVAVGGRNFAGLPLVVSVGVAVVLAVLFTTAGVVGAQRTAVGLVAAAVTTSTWNAVTFLGLQLADLLLLLAVPVLVVDVVLHRRRVVVPAWIWFLGAGVLTTMLAFAWWPVSDAYLSTRYQAPLPSALQVGALGPALDNWLGGSRWLVACVVLPVAVCLVGRDRPALLGRLAVAWMWGTVVNALLALTDDLGVSAVSAALLPVIDVGGRQAGLTAAPNHLAVATALTLPIAVVRLTTSRPRWPSALAVVALGGGLVVSESRGSLVVALVGVTAALLLTPQGRRGGLVLAGVVVAALTTLVAYAPATLSSVAEGLRLAGGHTVEESDAQRAGLAWQAVLDAAHAPVRGVGLEVVNDGHNIALQLISAGGGVLLLGFLLSMGGFLRAGWRWARDGDLLARQLLLVGVLWMLVGLVENQLTDLFLYVPYALVAALATRSPSAPDDELLHPTTSIWEASK